MTHFRRRKESDSEGIAMRPSQILSSNSKDRYRAMKARILSVSTAEEGIPEESGESSRSQGSLPGRLLRSGRDSYANLYGTLRREPQHQEGNGDEESEEERERKRGDEVMEMSVSPQVRVKPGSVISSSLEIEEGTRTGEGHLFQLTSFDFRSNHRIVPLATVAGGEGNEEKKVDLTAD